MSSVALRIGSPPPYDQLLHAQTGLFVPTTYAVCTTSDTAFTSLSDDAVKRPHCLECETQIAAYKAKTGDDHGPSCLTVNGEYVVDVTLFDHCFGCANHILERRSDPRGSANCHSCFIAFCNECCEKQFAINSDLTPPFAPGATLCGFSATCPPPPHRITYLGYSHHALRRKGETILDIIKTSGRVTDHPNLFLIDCPWKRQ